MSTMEPSSTELLRRKLSGMGLESQDETVFRNLVMVALDVADEVDKAVAKTPIESYWPIDFVLEPLEARLDEPMTSDDPDPRLAGYEMIDRLKSRVENLVDVATATPDPTADEVDDVQVVPRLNAALLRAYEVAATVQYQRRLMSIAVDAKTSAVSADMHAAAADQARQKAEKAAGLAADATLSSQFKSEAQSQAWGKWIFRIFATTLFICSVVIAVRAGTTVSDRAPNDQWLYLIAHLIVTAAVLVLGGYLARLGGQHAARAEWAKTIEMQLLTFEAFTAPVRDDATRWRIHEEFARRVLGSPPVTGVVEDTAATPSVAALADLAAILKRSA